MICYECFKADAEYFCLCKQLSLCESHLGSHIDKNSGNLSFKTYPLISQPEKSEPV